ncbi:MAG: class I SAM-dependent methyltransferase [Litorimonas sp.]
MTKKDARFWNRIAKMYFTKPIANQDTYRIKLKTTQEYLHPDMEVLELGCGSGGTALTHAAYVKHIDATDIADRMIDIAKSQQAERGITNVKFSQASLNDLSKEGKHYDAILALSLIHLLEDPEAAISQVYDLLEPGGIFVASTPCLKGKLGLMRPVLKLGHILGILPRINSFSEVELTNWMELKGFKIIHIWQPKESDSVFTIARAPQTKSLKS